MTVFTYSRVAAYNPNTSPTSVARSASGSVYDIGDTGFLTPLNLTLVATNTVTTTLVSDANAMFPDFTLVDRTSVVFKSGSTAMVLTTTTPIPGPTGAASTVPGPAGPPTTDASLLAAGTVADARLPGRLSDATLSATFVPKWKATTAYLAGDKVLNPNGDVVSAKMDFTSGASYNAANWNLSAAFAQVPGPATAAAGTHRYLTLEAEDLRDLNELWVGDSIGNEQVEHIYLLAQSRAALNPTRSYVYHLIDSSTGLTWISPVTIQTGTGTGNAGGPFVTHLWNFAVSGMNASYAQGARYPVLLATAPDIIVMLHGKNEGTTAGGIGEAHWRGQYLAFTETIRQDLPFADLVCLLQIPNRDDGDMAKKNKVYAEIAAMRGYGVIDMHRLFRGAIQALGGTLTQYMKTDGIHPTTSADAPSPNGSLLMSQLELPYWTFSKETGAIRAQQVSALESNGDQLFTNGNFSDWTGALPAGWESNNATVTKDSRAGYFETVTGNGYGCRVQSIDASSAAYIRISFDATFRTKWAGKPITAIVRVRADTKTPTDSVTQGRLGWTDGVQGAVNSGNYAYARDGFHYRVLTFTPSAGAAYLRLTLWADSALTATADVTFDRVWIVPGVLPRKGSMGQPGATGPAGDPSATQIDFCSTVGSNPVVAAMSVAGSSSAVIGTANMGVVMPVKPHRNMNIAVLEWLTGTVSAGNYDLAILDSTGARLWSKGSTAWPAVSTTVTETVSPAVSLVAGQTYYIVLAADNTTATYKGLNAATNLLKLVTGAPHARNVGTIFPIPSTVTLGSTATGKLPLVMLREA